MQQEYKCPKCNSPITYGAQSCNNCGQPFIWKQPPQQTPQHQQKLTHSYIQPTEEHKKARVNKWQRLAKGFPSALAVVGLLLFAIVIGSQSQTPSTEPSITPPPASYVIPPSSHTSDCTCYSYTLKRNIPCEQATAICNDGTCSTSKSRSGTCSHHGGVKRWID
jgi:hypothetical protein